MTHGGLPAVHLTPQDEVGLLLGGVMLLALLIDRLWGEPPAALHPVVGFGLYLDAAGRRIPRRSPAAAFIGGALAWCFGAALVTGGAWWLQQSVARDMPFWLALPVLALALKPMLAWRMLKDEVRAVDAALAESLEAGRERLAWLVSRDTGSLSEAEVRETAIESLAENLNDSVVAPLFWFVLLGLPGAVLYRFANTADAMWGYRGERNGRDWTHAGRWAARADDVLSWLPARLTAMLLAIGANRAGELSLGRLRAEARLTPSPNGGWPMGAMALLIGVRLGKPGVYVLNAAGREPRAADVVQALVHASNALLVSVPIGFIALVFIAPWWLFRI